MKTATLWMSVLPLMAATPALATTEPSTRLVECQTGDCLLVTGYRDDADAPVTINGRAVSVEGKARWQLRLPVQTLRAWSTPNARSITISVDGEEKEARLPTGMFVRPEMLTMLVIRPK